MGVHRLETGPPDCYSVRIVLRGNYSNAGGNSDVAHSADRNPKQGMNMKEEGFLRKAWKDGRGRGAISTSEDINCSRDDAD